MAVGDIHIWVRSTVDWEDRAAFEAQIPERMRPRVVLWDSTFTMPFHLFRGRVRDIARASLEATGLPITDDWSRIPEGEFLLPVDDDDWFDPAIGDRLAAELGGDVDGAYWHSSWVEVATLRHRFYLLRRRHLPSWTATWWLTTNNYVIRRLPRLGEMAWDHVRASRWRDEEPERVKWIDARMSVANRNLGSQTSLGVISGEIQTPEELLRSYRRYQRVYRKRVHRRLAWSRPYLEQMDELMAELQVS